MPYKLIKSERHAQKCRTNESYSRGVGRDGYNGDGYKVAIDDDGKIILYSFAIPIKPRKLGMRRSDYAEKTRWGGKVVAIVSNDPKTAELPMKLLESA